jgi:hypothetical protein
MACDALERLAQGILARRPTMYVIYDEANAVWLQATDPENTWTADVGEALTWATTCEATEAATAAGICTCWVVAV